MKKIYIAFLIICYLFLLFSFFIALILIGNLICFPHTGLSQDLAGNILTYIIPFGLVNTVLLIIFSCFIKNKFLFQSISLAKICLIYALFWVITLFSPFYFGYFISIDKTVRTADYYVSKDRWEKAINIYMSVEPFIEHPQSNILFMQTTLNEVGYYNYEIDGRPSLKIIKQLKKMQNEYGLGEVGTFGPQTKTIIYGNQFRTILKLDTNPSLFEIKNATKEFQKNHNLQQDGLIGLKTLGMLKKEEKKL